MSEKKDERRASVRLRRWGYQLPSNRHVASPMVRREGANRSDRGYASRTGFDSGVQGSRYRSFRLGRRYAGGGKVMIDKDGKYFVFWTDIDEDENAVGETIYGVEKLDSLGRPRNGSTIGPTKAWNSV